MVTRSEPLTAHLICLNHHRLLDLSKVRELPDSHTWPALRDHPFAGRDHSHNHEKVPVVDLEDSSVRRHLARACETWGVFQITGHGVPAGLLDRLESQCQRLFSLPAEQKLKALRAPDGISGYGQVRISSFFSKLMWSEGFTIVGSPEEHARKLWPYDHDQFCEVVEEYNQELKQLAGRLMTLMLESLGLPVEEVSWYRPAGQEKDGFPEATSVLQLNSYPACPDPERAMGLAAHTDSSLFTILHQNLVGGLQVSLPGRAVGDGDAAARALVVNVGDLFHIISNGRCPSVVHRAVVNQTQHRLSVAYLYGPPTHAEIAPLGPRTVNGRKAPLYRAVTWPEYLGIKSKKRFDQALESIKVAPIGDKVVTWGMMMTTAPSLSYPPNNDRLLITRHRLCSDQTSLRPPWLQLLTGFYAPGYEDKKKHV